MKEVGEGGEGSDWRKGLKEGGERRRWRKVVEERAGEGMVGKE